MTTLRSRSLVLAAGVLLLAAASARAGAQDVAGLTLIRDEATRDVVRSALDHAHAVGLPIGPLLSKAFEGIAKRASTKSIRDAMGALEKRMRRANELLAPDPSVDELAAGADALYAGVPDKTLRQMRALAPRRSIALELGVLTELVARKVPAARASRMVLELMAHGASGAQLTALSSAVQGDVAAGIKPDVARPAGARYHVPLASSAIRRCPAGPSALDSEVAR